MATLYDFRFTIRKAEAEGPFFSVHYGGSDTVYREECHQMTAADAKAHLAKISGEESRTHYASCGMKYSDQRKAPGLKTWGHIQAKREVKP
jgi:hypothetical protein